MNNSERHFTDGALLRSFVEIADTGNLTAASVRLNRSQSAISVQLRKLEQELGVPLFLRQGKGMTLTVQGAELLPRARQALDALAGIGAAFARPLDGRIRVGIPDDFDEGVLERTLVDFTHTHPGVEVRAVSGCASGYPDAVRDGELDMAVCSGPDNTAGIHLSTERAVWATGSATPVEPDKPVPLAIVSHGCWMGRVPAATLEAQGRDYRVAFQCSGLVPLKSAIRAGFAVGVLFEASVEPGMRILGSNDGFPELPAARRSILVRQGAPKDLADAMVAAIRRSVGGFPGDATQNTPTSPPSPITSGPGS